MMLFWVLAGVMLFVALLFTLPGLLRNQKAPDIDTDRVNVEIIRAQLAELEADLESGRLDKAQFHAAREDLERELLVDLSAESSQAGAHKVRSGRWMVWPLLVLIPGLTIGLYYQLGTRQIIPILEQDSVTPVAANPAADAASFADMVEGLAVRMRDEPDNAEGWVMLARSYQTLARFDDAAVAYANAHRLVGDNADLLTDYVDALVMANKRRFSDQAGALLLKALASEPGNIKALWLAGHWKQQQGDYAGAVSYWQMAAERLPADGEDARVIAEQIRAARSQLAPGAVIEAPAAPGETPAAQQVAANKSISVRITLDPLLADIAAPGDTVFVFARALSGPRMPLAIVRKQVSELPFTVTLDDSTAMTPAMKLSGFDAVTVTARITKSGAAMPQSGDLQGIVTPVKPGAGAGIELSINSRVP